MHEWMAMASAGIGLTQEGGDLPVNVPSVDPVGGGATQGPPGGAAPGGTTQPGFPLMWLLLLVLLFMVVSTVMTSRREKRRVSQMLQGLKRGDRVQTVAGIIGTVHEVKDDSVVIRVDEATGTKMQFAKSAVQHVLKPARTDSKDEGAAGAE